MVAVKVPPLRVGDVYIRKRDHVDVRIDKVNRRGVTYEILWSHLLWTVSAASFRKNFRRQEGAVSP